jgi:hypothetical protein
MGEQSAASLFSAGWKAAARLWGEIKREPLKKADSLLDFLAGPMGLEPTPSGVTGRRYNQLNYDPKKSFFQPICTFFFGRRDRARTCDIHGVSVALFQLSYPPPCPKKAVWLLATLSWLVKR